MAAAPSKVEAVVNLAKRRGLVYPSGEIYGGTRSAWDYGPLGVELKENIKRQWWRTMVTSRDDVVGLDSSVILPRQVWEASGHVEVFTDHWSSRSTPTSGIGPITSSRPTRSNTATRRRTASPTSTTPRPASPESGPSPRHSAV